MAHSAALSSEGFWKFYSPAVRNREHLFAEPRWEHKHLWLKGNKQEGVGEVWSSFSASTPHDYLHVWVSVHRLNSASRLCAKYETREEEAAAAGAEIQDLMVLIPDPEGTGFYLWPGSSLRISCLELKLLQLQCQSQLNESSLENKEIMCRVKLFWHRLKTSVSLTPSKSLTPLSPFEAPQKVWASVCPCFTKICLLDWKRAEKSASF